MYKICGIEYSDVKIWKSIIRNRFFDGFNQLPPNQQNDQIIALEQTLINAKENYPLNYREYRIAAKHFLVEMQFAIRMRNAQKKADKIFAKMVDQQRASD